MKWRFLNTGFRPGFINMKLDEELARDLVEGQKYSTVRVYGWSPPAISLGRNQSRDDLNQEKARADGIDIVRRPTGGRAILHSDEVTYSVVFPAKSRSIIEEYNRISQALVAGMRLLGVRVSLERNQPHFPSLYRSAASAACYASSAQYEVKVDGKKLIGSAQRRYISTDGNEVVLQHGSILLGPDHRRIIQYLSQKDESNDRALNTLLQNQAIDLSTVLHRKVLFEEVAQVLRIGFERNWEIEFEVWREEDLHKPIMSLL